MGQPHHVVPLRTAVPTWFRVSLRTFGGPAGQIAVMHRELVEDRRWVGEHRFLHALGFCTLLPGPEAQQLAIYLGWLLNGTVGGLVAGALFVLPGFLAIMALSAVYAGLGDTAVVTALFAGVAPAVLAIVVQAVLRVRRRALGTPVLQGLAVAAFAALALFAVPFPVVVAVAGLAGLVLGRRSPALLRRPAPVAAAAAAAAVDEGGDGDAPSLLPDDDAGLEGRRRTSPVLVVGVGVAVWVVPLVVLGAVLGGDNVFVQEGRFFSGAALVTFGGAYAVLSYVAQRAVEVYGWLTPGEMVTGLAMAETTPGPLIQVVQFVGFMGAFRDPGTLDPYVAGVLGACLVTWVTYVPCFLFIFLGAPHVERLRREPRLADALAGVTAAVVGVIANLALFFALSTLFDRVDVCRAGPLQVQVPALDTLDLRAAATAVMAFVLLFRLRWSVLRTIGACAVAGGALHLLTT